MPSTSLFDRALKPVDGQTGVPVDFAQAAALAGAQHVAGGFVQHTDADARILLVVVGKHRGQEVPDRRRHAGQRHLARQALGHVLDAQQRTLDFVQDVARPVHEGAAHGGELHLARGSVKSATPKASSSLSTRRDRADCDRWSVSDAARKLPRSATARKARRSARSKFKIFSTAAQFIPAPNARIARLFALYSGNARPIIRGPEWRLPDIARADRQRPTSHAKFASRC
jgi:hypothetical protein